ncbi:MAG TPA: ABC transporter ATP-binding protein, partial [Burkholderiales bacterium]|nr:ABC transporter ATP-binding protein [Burkholderiales bacterium]
TLFVVSHDRAFLDNVVTQVIAFEGEGRLREYAGGYSDWGRQRREAAAAERETGRTTRRAVATREAPRSPTRAKLSYKETQELEALPQRVSALEEEQARITKELADPSLYRDAPDRVKALQSRYSAVEEELMSCLARWEALDARSKIGTDK